MRYTTASSTILTNEVVIIVTIEFFVILKASPCDVERRHVFVREDDDREELYGHGPDDR